MGLEGSTADSADIRFLMFADAENPRACGVAFTAAQRISPYQPFMGVVLAGTKTVLSLHAVQTNQSRDRAAARVNDGNDRRQPVGDIGFLQVGRETKTRRKR